MLNVIMCLDPVEGGGSVERVYQLSRELALAGETCTILTTMQGWSDEHARALGNVKVVALPYLTKRYKIPLGLGRWLREHVRDYDLVHLSMNWTVISAITYLYLRIYRRPYAFSAMGFAVSLGTRSRLLKRVFRVLFTRPMATNACACIAVSAREVQDYEQLGVAQHRIALIPNAIPAESFVEYDDGRAFRARHGLERCPYILFIGRLHPIKGPDLLIQAFATIVKDFPDHRLIIAGNNYGFLSDLERLARSHDVLERVIFRDPIFGDEKKSAYRGAELFVIPSRFDTMTIVALEAAALGAPILLTNQCDFGALQDAGGAIAVDANVEALAAGLVNALNRPDLREMGSRGRQFVLRSYRWDSVRDQFISVFKQCLLERQ